MSWEVVEGFEHGVVSADGEYQAPYFAPYFGPDSSRTATVRASAGAGQFDAQVTFMVGPADRDACFGTLQNHLPGSGDYVYVDTLPEAIYRVAPIYPQLAREAGVDGTVMLQALVCSSGLVMETRVIRSIPMLDEAAVEAVRHWVFRPAKAGGEPVAVWVGIPVGFSLH